MDSSDQPQIEKCEEQSPASMGSNEETASEATPVRPSGFIAAWKTIFASRALLVTAGFLIAGLFIWLTAQKIDWTKVSIAFSTGHWLPWVPLSVLAYIGGMLVRGYRLQLLVRDEAAISVGTASNIIAVGYATNNILPARLGEFARAAMLAERTGLPYVQSLTITFLERLLDGMAILLLAVAGTLLIPVEGWMLNTAILAAFVLLSAVMAVLFITMLPQTAIALTSNLFSPFGSKIHSKAVAFVTQINRGFACLKSMKSTIAVSAASILVWVVEGIFFMLIMPCFAIPMGFIRALLTMAFTNLGILIPSSPGYVGIYHFIVSKTLISVSSVAGASPGSVSPLLIDENTALSYAVVVHLVFFITVTVWGVFALARYSMEVGSTAAMAWDAKPIASLPEQTLQSASVITSYPEISSKTEREITQFWSGLCDCFVPPEHKPLDSQKASESLREATKFLVTELEVLPFRLRVLFAIGITGFKTIFLLTNFNFLCNVPLEKRRKTIEAWAFGPIALTRKFMKPIRALFLFAYYEQQEVKDHLDNLKARQKKESSTGTTSGTEGGEG